MSIGIISWIVVGLISGILGKLIMPGRDPDAQYYQHHRPANAAQTDTAPTKRPAYRRRARGALRANDSRLE